MLKWLLNLFFGNKKKRIKEIADRIERFKKRYEQTKDMIKYNISNKYHTLILNSSTVEEAEHYEREFYKKIEELGTDLKNYRQSKDYADTSSGQTFYDSNISTSSYTEEASTIYYSSHISKDTNTDNQITEGEGEFGGGGASASWEETASDNS